MAGQRVDALAKALSRGGSRRYLLGGLLAGALAVELGPSAELAEAAKSPKQCRQINNRRKRRRCLRIARRRNNRIGQGLLRNFALTVVNNSSKEWLFVVAIPGVDRGRQERVGRKSTRRFFIEDDSGEVFVHDGRTTPNGDYLGGGLIFDNPTFSEVWAAVYTEVTWSTLHNELTFRGRVDGSRQEMKEGDSRTINLGFVSFVLKRNPNDKNKGDFYIEFELTFS
jgi:hypothetical protein